MTNILPSELRYCGENNDRQNPKQTNHDEISEGIDIPNSGGSLIGTNEDQTESEHRHYTGNSEEAKYRRHVYQSSQTG